MKLRACSLAAAESMVFARQDRMMSCSASKSPVSSPRASATCSMYLCRVFHAQQVVQQHIILTRTPLNMSGHHGTVQRSMSWESVIVQAFGASPGGLFRRRELLRADGGPGHGGALGRRCS